MRGFQILMTWCLAPAANHSLPGSTAMLRTHPKCPELTRMSFRGAWYGGAGRFVQRECSREFGRVGEKSRHPLLGCRRAHPYIFSCGEDKVLTKSQSHLI